jgi:large subunit ribosomal protein L6
MTQTQTQTQTGAHRASRVGKRPVEIPSGVQVTITGRKLWAKGPKGEGEQEIHGVIELKKEGNLLVVAPRSGAGDEFAQYQGLTRTLVRNLLEGVSKSYARSLDLIGTGYRAEVKGQDLTLALGYSHPIHFRLPDGVKARVEILDVGGTKRPRLHLESHDKQLLGQTAARIRAFRPPEPYKGKGVRYVDERVREKAGKASAKGGKK